MKQKEAKGIYLLYALLTFLAFAGEVVVVVVEHAIYGIDMNDWGIAQTIIHWAATCIIWGFSAYLLTRFSKKKLGFNPFDFNEKPNTKQMLIALIVSILFVVYMTFLWDWQLKPIAEFFNKMDRFSTFGIVAFVFQNVYYVFESILMFLLIAFGQAFGEKAFDSSKIPWGGILLSLTWGLGHIFTKDLATGLFSLFWGTSFGIVYLLMNKNPRYAYPIIALLFIL